MYLSISVTEFVAYHMIHRTYRLTAAEMQLPVYVTKMNGTYDTLADRKQSKIIIR